MAAELDVSAALFKQWFMVGVLVVVGVSSVVYCKSKRDTEKVPPSSTSLQRQHEDTKRATSEAPTQNASPNNTNTNEKEMPRQESVKEEWRCVCETGFLPPGLLRTFGGAEAVMRLGSGQCYHKQV